MFAYTAARQNPKKLYLGVDANARPLEKLSQKIHRSARKGGASNVLFIEAAAEALPCELDGSANEVYVHFPWGSLLRAVTVGDAVLRGVRRLCAPGATLRVITGLDPVRDFAEVSRLELPDLSVAYIDATLQFRYRASGFEIVQRGTLTRDEWSALQTSWAKRLNGSATRVIYGWTARAIETPSS